MSVSTLLSSVGATGAGSSVRYDGSGGVQVHVYSAAGSSATVLIQGSIDGSAWVTLATITNPGTTGEVWRGVAFPQIRANVTAWVSGAISAAACELKDNPGAWASSIAAASSSAPSYGIIKYSWTNAEIVAGGGGGVTYNATIGTLPANSRILATYAIVGTQATFAAGTLTVSLGFTSTDFVDWLLAGSIKAADGTIYGDGVAERAATHLDGQLFYAAAKTVKAQFLGGAGDLADVTTSAGTIYVEFVTYP